MDYTIENELELLRNKCAKIQHQISEKNTKLAKQIIELSQALNQEKVVLANTRKQQQEQLLIREQNKIQPIEEQVKYGGVFGLFQKQKKVVVNQDEIELYNIETNNLILEHSKIQAVFEQKLDKLKTELAIAKNEEYEYKNELEKWRTEKAKIIAMVKTLDEINFETE